MTFHAADGWRCCSMHDPAGRRGVWYRRLPDGGIEVRAGRHILDLIGEPPEAPT